MEDEILTGKMKWGVIICVLLIASSVSPVYAFDFSEKWNGFVDKVRDIFGLETRPKISANLIIPAQMTTTQSDPSKIEIKISNDGSSCSVHITGKVYQNGKHVDSIDKRIELGKKSELTTGVYNIEPLLKNEGEWTLELSIVAENGRGTDEETVSGGMTVISPPLIEAEISKLDDFYSIAKEESKSLAPSVTIKNLGSNAKFQVYIEVKKDSQIVHSTTNSVTISKNGQTIIELYTLHLDQPENEGKWEFNVKIEASNEAGKDSETLSAETELIGAPLIKAVRSLDKDKMRREEDLVVKVSLENIGYGDAYNVVFEDELPQYFPVVEDSGSKSFRGTIQEGEKKTVSYTVRPSKKGDYTFPAVTVYYDGELIKGLSSKTNTNFIKVYGIPKLELTREFSRDKILKGESTTVTIKISNVGDGIAKFTSFSDQIPTGVHFSSGAYSITDIDIQPGETKPISYTVSVPNKGQYTFPSITAYHMDELLDKKYQPKVSSKILIVYGIPKIEFVSPFGVNPGEVVGDTTKLYVTIKNSGDGIAKNVYFSYESLPSAFEYYAGFRSWSGTLNPGESKYIEYTVLNDDTGTFEVSEADCSFKDELGNPYSRKISPISITVIGSKLVDFGLEVEFDDDWASQYVPILGICSREYEHWQEDSNHHPTWYYRVVLDRTEKHGIVQFFAYWPDQYKWWYTHLYDYEPIWIFFEFSGENWENGEVVALIYTKGHSAASAYGTDEFDWSGKHPYFRLKSGHHAYDGGEFNPVAGIKMYYQNFTVFKLTDRAVDEWNTHYGNPFIESGGDGAVSYSIFINPLNMDEACFRSQCSLEGTDNGYEDWSYGLSY